jgi:hypothetical protein
MGSRWEADGNRKPIGNRSRRASPGSIRSPGVPRCCWTGNTVQRRSTVRCLRGSRLLCWWPSPSAEPASAGWPPPRARARSPCSCGSRGRRRGQTGFRRRGAARCRLRAAGPRALNSWSRQVRHAQPGWPPQLPEPSTPVRPRRLIAARESARPAAPDPAPPPHRPVGNRRPQGSISAAAAVRA